MKNITKSIVALAAVTLLAGCSAQKQCDEATAKDRAAKILVENKKLSLGDDFSAEIHQLSRAELKDGSTVGSLSSDMKMAYVYDKNACFYYALMEMTTVETGKEDSYQAIESWSYYLNGNFYVASSSTTDKKTDSKYNKTEMSQEAANIAFASSTATAIEVFKMVNSGLFLDEIEEDISLFNGSQKASAEAAGASFSSKLFLGSDDEQSLYFEGSADGGKDTVAETVTFHISSHAELMYEYKQNHAIRSKMVEETKKSDSNGNYDNEYEMQECKFAYSKASLNYPKLEDFIEL